MPQTGSIFRHVPNAISVARIAATPVLIYLALSERETAYAWVLLAALLSDILDGMIARMLSLTSSLGSRLDTLADALLWVGAIFGIGVFHPELLTEHWPIAVLVLGFWALEHVVAVLRYGRLTSFHNYLIRIGAYALGIFVVSLFFFGLQPWLLYVAAALNVLGSIEELIIIALLPEWTDNVRGLYWLLQKRKVGAA